MMVEPPSANLDCMPGNLVPEQRPDKHGKVVTRHVLAQASQVPAKPMPAPMLNMPRFSTSTTTIPDRVDGLRDLWDHNAVIYTDHTMSDIDPRAVEEIDRLLSVTTMKIALSDAIQDELNVLADSGSTTGIHNIAVFGDIVVEHRPYSSVQSYVEGFTEMGLKDHDYLLAASDSEREEAKLLVSFIVRAEKLNSAEHVVRYGDSHDSTWLRDPEMVRYIRENPEKADAVLEVLDEADEALTIDLIKARMAHGVSSLRDGVL